jgi:hypothetical protein
MEKGVRRGVTSRYRGENRSVVEDGKEFLEFRSKKRKAITRGEGYQVREASARINEFFRLKTGI